MTIAHLVESVILARDELFIHAAPTALDTGLGVLCDGAWVPLEPVEGGTSWPSGLPFRKVFSYPEEGACLAEYLPDGTRIGFGAEGYVNVMLDWMLENGITLQIRVDGVDEPHLIAIDEPVHIPASNAPRRFEALVGLHRCDADLVVRFDPGAAGQVTNVEIPLDPALGGGRSRAGYQHVSIPVPLSGCDLTVSMAVGYRRYLSDGSDDHPYVFIANAQIVAGDDPHAGVQPRSEIVGTHPGGAWFRARVPQCRSTRDTPLCVTLGDDRVEVFAPEQNEVTLVADYGHSLVLRARERQGMALFIDGRAAQTIELGPDETWVRLPADHLRGEIVTVSIRDLSGSTVFLTLPVLAPRLLTPHDVMARETRAPLPTDLTRRANHRYQALRAHLRHPVPGLDPASLSIAAEALDQTHDTVALTPIAFPEVESPKVSVIIPAHDRVKVTYYALCALLVAHNSARFEVIVVDDGSSDATTHLEDIVTGIRVVRTPEPQRFIRACNAGVAQARGEYVVLLNNDTEPTVGWLDTLLDAFDRFEGVGLAGSKLLFPDGTLQEAGGIVWGTGDPWNYGNGENPWDPRFCYARQADYLSGAALMTTRAIWDHVGGLSDYLEPMYFEDTDLAFKVRAAGFKTYFVPASIVYHFEGTTCGTDPATGFKRYQDINRPKFKRRWAGQFAQFGKDKARADLEKDRGIAGRVLFIDHATPREDRDAGSYAARREIDLVQSLGYKVTFLPQNFAHLGSYTEDLERSGVEMIHAPFYMSVAEFLEHRGAEFDAVYITRYTVAQDTIARVRKLAPQARIILNAADLHFLRELRAALSTDDPARLVAMRSVRDRELAMMTAADLVLSYNEVEHSVIASHTDGQARVMTCPWVVEIAARVPPLKGRKGLSFLGSFHHHPNAQAVAWFCAEVMPRLSGTGAHLTIYGSGMGPEIAALASDTVHPAGFIETLADAYDPHRIFVAPLLSGAGIKGKVLNAIAHGIPTILSPVAAEGIGLRNGHDCLIAETPHDWAEAIARLSTDDKLWLSMSKAARLYAAEQFSFAAGRDRMKAAFEAIDLFGSV
jgi:GT2 family glycosyltransferase